jgi:glucose-6-phosphate dehydrogenase assembly protein OpcA
MTASRLPLDQIHVDVRTIERELSAIWRSAADEREPARTSVTRTCVLNLVVLTFDGMRGVEPATAVIDRLTAQHPNRAVVVGVDAQAAVPYLDAWVQAHCQLPAPGRPQVCGEQITIEARGAAAGQALSGLMLPLLVPDLPVMLWLPACDALDQPLSQRVQRLADRVIVDSMTASRPLDSLRTLAELTARGVALSDIAWGRLTAWRELVAGLFDAADHREHLDGIYRVTIDHAGDDAAHAQALLLAGWLASCLDWQIVSHEHGGVVWMRQQRQPVRVELRPRVDAPAAIVAVELSCARARFGVFGDALPDRATVSVQIGGRRQMRQSARLDVLDAAALLGREVQLLGIDHSYVAALRTAATMV